MYILDVRSDQCSSRMVLICCLFSLEGYGEFSMASLPQTQRQTQGEVPVSRHWTWRRPSRRIPGVEPQTADLSTVIRLAARPWAHRSVRNIIHLSESEIRLDSFRLASISVLSCLCRLCALWLCAEGRPHVRLLRDQVWINAAHH